MSRTMSRGKVKRAWSRELKAKYSSCTNRGNRKHGAVTIRADSSANTVQKATVVVFPRTNNRSPQLSSMLSLVCWYTTTSRCYRLEPSSKIRLLISALGSGRRSMSWCHPSMPWVFMLQSTWTADLCEISTGYGLQPDQLQLWQQSIYVLVYVKGSTGCWLHPDQLLLWQRVREVAWFCFLTMKNRTPDISSAISAVIGADPLLPR